MIVEKILSQMAASKPKAVFDLSPFLDKSFDPVIIYQEELASLSTSQLELLIAMFVLDSEWSLELGKELGLGKTLKKDLEMLQKRGLVCELEDSYVLQKKRYLHQWMRQNPDLYPPARSKS